jgi:hypothetical protein
MRCQSDVPSFAFKLRQLKLMHIAGAEIGNAHFQCQACRRSSVDELICSGFASSSSPPYLLWKG